MLAALLPPAFGHVPHDPIVALAAPPGLEDTTTWWLLAAAHGFDELCTSDDGGRTWTFAGGPPLTGPLLDGALLSDGTVAVLVPGRLWTRAPTKDWIVIEVPAGLTELEGGDELLLAGEAGVWTVDPAVRQLDRAVALLAPGPVSLDGDGRVWVRRAGEWTAIGSPTPDPVSALGVGTAVYVGARDGGLFRWDGEAWDACGALPAAGRHAEIAALAWDGSRLLAAPGWHGPYASTDDCATWEDAGAGLDTLWSATDADGPDLEVWRGFAASGDRWVLGGWSGVFTTEDAGGTWSVAPYLPAATSRGIAFYGDPSDGGSVVVATYAAGIGLLDPEGGSLSTPGHGLPYTNTQWVTTLGDQIYALAAHRPFVSDDGGSSWRRLLPEADHVYALYAWDDALWALTTADRPLQESRDRGETWGVPEGVGELPGVPMRASSCEGSCAGAVRCVATLDPAAVVCGQDGHWSRLWTEPVSITGGCADDAPVVSATRVTTPVLWPPTAPTRVIVGHDAGLEILSLDGSSRRSNDPADGDPPMTLAVADDGTLVLGTRSGRMLWSADGGDQWTDLEIRLPAVPLYIAPWPGFASARRALVGTPDGLWSVDLDLGSGLRWAPVDRVDDSAPQMVVRAGTAAIEEASADLDTVLPLEPGALVETWVRGHTVRVRGISQGLGTAELLVDGERVATLGEEATDGVAEIARVEGLDDGWHLVQLRGVDGAGLALDSVEGWADPAEAEPAGSGRSRGCGSGGAAAFGWLLGRRRRR